MVKFAPPRRLAQSLPFTAIQEEARVAVFGARFFAWNECFHYLLPADCLGDGLRKDAPSSPFFIFSCMYNPISRQLSLTDIAPIEDPAGWEEAVKEINFRLINQDPHREVRY